MYVGLSRALNHYLGGQTSKHEKSISSIDYREYTEFTFGVGYLALNLAYIFGHWWILGKWFLTLYTKIC